MGKINCRMDVEKIINVLKERRKVFSSEADFQLEFAWIIKELYPKYKVRLEYSPSFNTQMHIDILVITDKGWIPIELKYKTKGKTFTIDGDVYNLKDQSAKDQGCYNYLKDIERIESIKGMLKGEFIEGYTIMLTNDLSYKNEPKKKDCYYREFSINDGCKKSGKMSWDERASKGTKQGCENAIVLRGSYSMKWREYCVINEETGGTFIYLVNRI